MYRPGLAWVVVGLAAMLVACGGRSGDRSAGESLAEGVAGSEAAPPFPEGLTWFNVAEPVALEDLRGKMVLLDFWTLGCINCQHIVPDLERLEAEFADSLVVIGVHSGKYDTEHADDSVRESIERLGISHPVVNDPDFAFWNAYGARAWPTLVLVDPEGRIAGARAGEGVYAAFRPALAAMEAEFGERIDRTPFAVQPNASAASSVLRYPSDVAIDKHGDRLFIADAGHNRILVATLDGELVRVVGTGEQGFADGGATEARFNQPQGISVSQDGMRLFVADTRNHAVRVVDLESWEVKTVAGTGARLRSIPSGSVAARETDLASPWGLVEHAGTLYVSMAGSHQVWSMDLETGEIQIYAGTSREGLNDGDRLDEATLAQPSGIVSDGEALLWADAEGSAIRRLGFAGDNVETLIGTGLFDFGDRDGIGLEAQLQHPQDLALVVGDVLYIADTYNHKLRALDLATGEVTTFVGSGGRGWADGEADEALFDEPSGIDLTAGTLYVADTNNHLIRRVDRHSGEVSTLQLSNLSVLSGSVGDILRAELEPQRVMPGVTNIRFVFRTPDGYRMNNLAPSRLELRSSNESVVELSESVITWTNENTAVEVPVPVALMEGDATVTVAGQAYYCEKAEAQVCLIAQLELVAPVTVSPEATAGEVVVDFELPPA